MPHTSGLVLGSLIGILLLLPQVLGCGLDGLDDVRVPGAAAEVAADGLADLRLGGILVAGEQGAARDHHPRRAVAALQPVVLPERLLDRVQLSVLLQAFHRGDLRALGLDGEDRARLHRIAVEQHRAGAAVRGVAADVRAGQAQVLAEQVDEQQPRLDLHAVRSAVDGQLDVMPGHGYQPPARSTAFFSARTASTRAIPRLYSTDPRRSAVGDAASAARRAASAMAASLTLFPIRASSAAEARAGTGPALVSAIPTCAKVPAPSSVTWAAAAAVE